MNKMINSIQHNISLSDKANDYFTQSLIHLENERPAEARRAALMCFNLSDSIEQRLATKMLITMSYLDSEEVNKTLVDVYSHSQMNGGDINE